MSNGGGKTNSTKAPEPAPEPSPDSAEHIKQPEPQQRIEPAPGAARSTKGKEDSGERSLGSGAGAGTSDGYNLTKKEIAQKDLHRDNKHADIEITKLVAELRTQAMKGFEAALKAGDSISTFTGDALASKFPEADSLLVGWKGEAAKIGSSVDTVKVRKLAGAVDSTDPGSGKEKTVNKTVGEKANRDMKTGRDENAEKVETKNGDDRCPSASLKPSPAMIDAFRELLARAAALVPRPLRPLELRTGTVDGGGARGLPTKVQQDGADALTDLQTNPNIPSLHLRRALQQSAAAGHLDEFCQSFNAALKKAGLANPALGNLQLEEMKPGDKKIPGMPGGGAGLVEQRFVRLTDKNTGRVFDSIGPLTNGHLPECKTADPLVSGELNESAAEALKSAKAARIIREIETVGSTEAVKRLSASAKGGDEAARAALTALIVPEKSAAGWQKEHRLEHRFGGDHKLPDLSALSAEDREALRIAAIKGLRDASKDTGLSKAEASALGLALADRVGNGKDKSKGDSTIAKEIQRIFAGTFEKQIDRETQVGAAREYAKRTEQALDGLFSAVIASGAANGPGMKELALLYSRGAKSENNRFSHDPSDKGTKGFGDYGKKFAEHVTQFEKLAGQGNPAAIEVLAALAGGAGKHNTQVNGEVIPAGKSRYAPGDELATRASDALTKIAKEHPALRMDIMKVLTSDAQLKMLGDESKKLETLGRIAALDPTNIPDQVRITLRDGLKQPQTHESAVKGMMSMAAHLGSKDIKAFSENLSPAMIDQLRVGAFKVSPTRGAELSNALAGRALDQRGEYTPAERIEAMKALAAVGPYHATSDSIAALKMLGGGSGKKLLDMQLRRDKDFERNDKLRAEASNNIRHQAAETLLNIAEHAPNNRRKTEAFNAFANRDWDQLSKDFLRPDGPLHQRLAQLMRDNPENVAIQSGVPKLLYGLDKQVANGKPSDGSTEKPDAARLAGTFRDRGASLPDEALRQLSMKAIERYGKDTVAQVSDRLALFNALPPDMRRRLTGSDTPLKDGTELSLKGRTIDAKTFNSLPAETRKALFGTIERIQEPESLIFPTDKTIKPEQFNKLPENVRAKLSADGSGRRLGREDACPNLKGRSLDARTYNSLNDEQKKILNDGHQKGDKLSEGGTVPDLSRVSLRSAQFNSLGSDLKEALGFPPKNIPDGQSVSLAGRTINAKTFNKLPEDVREAITGSMERLPEGRILLDLSGTSISAKHFNSLGKEQRISLSATDQRLDAGVVLGQLANGTIKDSDSLCRVLIGEPQLEKQLDKWQKDAAADAQKADANSKMLCQLREQAVRQMAKQAETGVGWFNKLKAFVADEFGEEQKRFIREQGNKIFDIKSLDAAIKQQSLEAQRTHARRALFETAGANYEFARLSRLGDTYHADRLALSTVKEHGQAALDRSPDIARSLFESGEGQHSGTLGRMHRAGDVQFRELLSNSEIGTAKGFDKGMTMLKELQPDTVGERRAKGTAFDDAALIRKEAFRGIDADPSVRRLSQLSHTAAEQLNILSKQIGTMRDKKGDRFKDFIDDVNRRGKIVQDALNGLTDSDIKRLYEMRSAMEKALKDGTIKDETSKIALQKRIDSLDKGLLLFDKDYDKEKYHGDKLKKIEDLRAEARRIRKWSPAGPDYGANPNPPADDPRWKELYRDYDEHRARFEYYKEKFERLTREAAQISGEVNQRANIEKLVKYLDSPEAKNESTFETWVKTDGVELAGSVLLAAGATALVIATFGAGTSVVLIAAAGTIGWIGGREGTRELQFRGGIRNEGSLYGEYQRKATVQDPDGTERRMEFWRDVAHSYGSEFLIGTGVGILGGELGGAIAQGLKGLPAATRAAFMAENRAALNNISRNLVAVEAQAAKSPWIAKFVSATWNELKKQPVALAGQQLADKGTHEGLKALGVEIEQGSAVSQFLSTALYSGAFGLMHPTVKPKTVGEAKPGDPHLKYEYNAGRETVDRYIASRQKDHGSQFEMKAGGVFIETTKEGLKIEWSHASEGAKSSVSRPTPVEATGAGKGQVVPETPQLKAANERMREVMKPVAESRAIAAGLDKTFRAEETAVKQKLDALPNTSKGEAEANKLMKEMERKRNEYEKKRADADIDTHALRKKIEASPEYKAARKQLRAAEEASASRVENTTGTDRKRSEASRSEKQTDRFDLPSLPMEPRPRLTELEKGLKPVADTTIGMRELNADVAKTAKNPEQLRKLFEDKGIKSFEDYKKFALSDEKPQQMRTYEVSGHPGVKIMVPKEHAAMLDKVREHRKAVESHFLDRNSNPEPYKNAKQFFKDHPGADRMLLPEEVAHLLKELPDGGRGIKEIVLSDKGSPVDPYNTVKYFDKLNGTRFESAAHVEGEKLRLVIFESASRSGMDLGELMNHEWAHTLEHSQPKLRQAFDFAMEFEKNAGKAVNFRDYASYNNKENWAVHIGEVILAKDPDAFAKMVKASKDTPSACKMLVMGEALEHSLTQSERLGHKMAGAEDLRERIQYMRKELLPGAQRDLIARIENPANGNEGLKAANILACIGRESTARELFSLAAKNSARADVIFDTAGMITNGRIPADLALLLANTATGKVQDRSRTAVSDQIGTGKAQEFLKKLKPSDQNAAVDALMKVIKGTKDGQQQQNLYDALMSKLDDSPRLREKALLAAVDSPTFGAKAISELVKNPPNGANNFNPLKAIAAQDGHPLQAQAKTVLDGALARGRATREGFEQSTHPDKAKRHEFDRRFNDKDGLARQWEEGKIDGDLLTRRQMGRTDLTIPDRRKMLDTMCENMADAPNLRNQMLVGIAGDKTLAPNLRAQALQKLGLDPPTDGPSRRPLKMLAADVTEPVMQNLAKKALLINNDAGTSAKTDRVRAIEHPASDISVPAAASKPGRSSDAPEAVPARRAPLPDEYRQMLESNRLDLKQCQELAVLAPGIRKEILDPLAAKIARGESVSDAAWNKAVKLASGYDKIAQFNPGLAKDALSLKPELRAAMLDRFVLKSDGAGAREQQAMSNLVAAAKVAESQGLGDKFLSQVNDKIPGAELEKLAGQTSNRAELALRILAPEHAGAVIDVASGRIFGKNMMTPTAVERTQVLLEAGAMTPERRAETIAKFAYEESPKAFDDSSKQRWENVAKLASDKNLAALIGEATAPINQEIFQAAKHVSSAALRKPKVFKAVVAAAAEREGSSMRINESGSGDLNNIGNKMQDALQNGVLNGPPPLTGPERIAAIRDSMDLLRHMELHGKAEVNHSRLALLKQATSTDIAALTPEHAEALGKTIARQIDAGKLSGGERKEVFEKLLDAQSSAGIGAEGREQIQETLAKNVTPMDVEHFSVQQRDKYVDALSQHFDKADKQAGVSQGTTMRTIHDLVNRLVPDTVSREVLDRHLGGLSEPQQKQLLNGRAGYASQSGLRESLNRMAASLPKDFVETVGESGFGGKHGFKVRKITAVATTDEGRALAYEFRKMTGIEVEIKSPKEIGGSKAVLFDNVDRLNTKDKSNVERLQKDGQVTIAKETQEFHKGLNIFDMAAAKTNPEHLQARIKELAGIDKSQALRTDGKVSGVLYDALNKPVTQARENGLAKAVAVLGHEGANARAIASVIRDASTFVTNSQFMEASKQLHQQIVPGHKLGQPLPGDTLFVVMPRSTSPSLQTGAESGHLAMQMYRVANGLTGAQYDANFVSPAQLKARMEQAAREGTKLNVVALNDCLGSGSEAKAVVGRLKDLQSTVSESVGRKAQVDITYGAAVGAKTALEGTKEAIGDGAKVVTGKRPLADFLQDVQRTLPGSRKGEEFVAKFKKNDFAKEPTGFFFDYMFANTTSKPVADMLDALGWRGARSGQRVNQASGPPK